jgi:sn-glycerol 3-phosphate transport system ATP-binding protein
LPPARGEPGRQGVVGLRPEHLEAAPDGPLSVRVELLERLGADTILHGTIDSTRMTARVPGSFALELGSTVAFAIRPEHIHLFDPDTGKRI